MRTFILGALAGASLFYGTAAMANPVTLTFEGVSDYLTDFYQADYHLTFSDKAVVGTSNGRTVKCPDDKNCSFLEHSGKTGGSIVQSTMNSDNGFKNYISFIYTSVKGGTIDIYSDANGTGNLLAEIELPGNDTELDYSHWVSVNQSFSGEAHSFVFTSYQLDTLLTNLSFDLNPAVVSSPAVPEPASWAMMLGGFGLVGGAMRSRRKAAVRFA